MKLSATSSLKLIMALLLGISSAACTTVNSDGTPVSEFDAERAAEANTRLGYEYLRQGDYERARAKLERAIEQDSGRPDARVWYGLAEEGLGNRSAAEQSLLKAQRLAPRSSGIQRELMNFYCRSDDYSKADMVAANLVSPTDASGRKTILLARCAADAGNESKAESFLGELLAADARHPAATLQLASLRLRQDRLDQAGKLLQRYETLHSRSAQSTLLNLRLAYKQGDQAAVKRHERRLASEFPDAWREYQQRTQTTEATTPGRDKLFPESGIPDMP